MIIGGVLWYCVPKEAEDQVVLSRLAPRARTSKQRAWLLAKKLR